MWMSRFNAIYMRQGVVEVRGNRLDNVVGLVEKLVIMRALVKKI